VTINTLKAYNIHTKLVFMEKYYSCSHNIKESSIKNIPFLTKLVQNKKEYKQLKDKYGLKLLDADNIVKNEKRHIFGKKIQINSYGKDLYAYTMLDGYILMDDICNQHKKWI
jgi:hypothetical protein